jgi:hypothetical protein
MYVHVGDQPAGNLPLRVIGYAIIPWIDLGAPRDTVPVPLSEDEVGP